MDVPADRRYTKEHEWALLEDDGTVRVGISDFAQHELGDVIYVELPAVGARVTQNEQIGEIESVKAVSDLYTPVGGRVTERNDQLIDNPELVNEGPYESGWMVKIGISDAAELDKLMTAEQYEAFLASQEH